MRKTLVATVGVIAVLAVAAGVRLAPWHEVFTPGGIRLLVDTDPHYHVLRAERILSGGVADVWFDARLNHPDGALVAWPPGFDAAIAAASFVAEGGAPSRSEIERVAAFFPVGLGLLAVFVQMLVARRWLGGSAAMITGILGALLPVQAQYGTLGVVDQHVAEQLGLCVAVLGVSASGSAQWRGRLLVALSVAAAPWIWQGSALTVGFVLLAAVVLYAARPQGNERAIALLRDVALGCAAGGVALAVSLLAWGPPAEFRSGGLNGLSWVHPASVLAVAAGLGVLTWFATLRPDASRARRALAGGVVVCGIGLAVGASMPGAVLHGLRSLRATDPWLRTIAEFQPVLFGSRGTLKGDLAWLSWAVGPLLAAPLLGFGALRRRWHGDPDARTGLTVLVAGSIAFVGLFLVRSRFVLYAAPFLVWWGALFLDDAISRVSGAAGRTRAAAAAALGILFVVPSVRLVQYPFQPAFDERLVQLLTWIRGQTPEGPRGVLGSWTLGHMVQYYADAPAVVTPFGTDVGAGGMRRQAAFFYAATLEGAEDVLAESQVRYVLFGDSYGEIVNAIAFAPHDAVPVLAQASEYWGGGPTVRRLPNYASSVPGWLYEHDGAPAQFGQTAGVPFLRLVYEALPPGAWYKLFERVEGARLHVLGAAPREEVVAYVEVATRQGRRIRWWTSVRADENGAARLRVPYATGRNGTSTATAYLLRAGGQVGTAVVPEDAVVRAGRVEVEFRK